MHKRLVALPLSFLFLACCIAPRLHAAQAVSLKPKWQTGKRYMLKMTTSQDSETTAPGVTKPIKAQTEQTMDLSVSVRKGSRPDTKSLEMVYESAAISVEMPGMTMSFDTKSDPATDAGNPLAIVMRGIVGAEFKCEVDGSGKVVSVEGVDDFIEKISGENPQARAMLGSMFSEDSFKQIFASGIESDWLPGKDVSLGETWSTRNEMPLGGMGTFEAESKYKFSKWEQRRGRRCAVLDFTGSFSSTASKAGQTDMGMAFDMKDGKLSGTTWFDPVLGAAVETTMKQSMDLHMGMPGAEEGSQGTSSKIEQTTTVELVKIESIK